MSEIDPYTLDEAWRAAIPVQIMSERALSLGGDDLVIRMLYELHAHVPEEQRPTSMSDLSDEQATRARKAVHAVLTEWQSACAALRSTPQGHRP